MRVEKPSATSKAIYGQDFIHKRQGLMGLQADEDAVPSMKRAKKIVKFADDVHA